MRRLVLTGQPAAVRAVGEVLVPLDGEESNWLLLTDEGSSPTALVAQARAMREFQEANPEADIAFAFPTTTAPQVFLDAWGGECWHCAAEPSVELCLVEVNGGGAHAYTTWPEAVGAALGKEGP